jgi:hypothetical protein
MGKGSEHPGELGFFSDIISVVKKDTPGEYTPFGEFFSVRSVFDNLLSQVQHIRESLLDPEKKKEIDTFRSEPLKPEHDEYKYAYFTSNTVLYSPDQFDIVEKALTHLSDRIHLQELFNADIEEYTKEKPPYNPDGYFRGHKIDVSDSIGIGIGISYTRKDGEYSVSNVSVYLYLTTRGAVLAEYDALTPVI